MKKIEDYIHLYTDIDILICEPGIEPVPATLEGFDYHQKKVIAERVNYDPTWVVPLLRPLSDLKQEEITYLEKIDEYASIPDRHFNPVAFFYLLSKKFDIFGLIEEGLAKNINNINQTQSNL